MRKGFKSRPRSGADALIDDLVKATVQAPSPGEVSRPCEKIDGKVNIALLLDRRSRATGHICGGGHLSEVRRGSPIVAVAVIIAAASPRMAVEVPGDEVGTQKPSITPPVD